MESSLLISKEIPDGLNIFNLKKKSRKNQDGLISSDIQVRGTF